LVEEQNKNKQKIRKKVIRFDTWVWALCFIVVWCICKL